MKRWLPLAIAASFFVVGPQLLIESAIYSRTVSIVGICLLLWISAIVPPFVPTLLLWALVPLFLAPIDQKFALPHVMAWAVDPVMALFFGGFALGVATEQNGLATRLSRFALKRSQGSYVSFLFLVILITAFFSMWISNIAAAALVFACLRPILAEFAESEILRRVLLIGVAFGANFGGIATPVGTGPNAIAIASLSTVQNISFLRWMAFAFPLTLGMLLLSFLLLKWRVAKGDNAWKNKEGRLNDLVNKNEELPIDRVKQMAFSVIFVGTAVLWLTEPLHKIPAAVVALASAAALFLSRVLKRNDILKIDWSTLLLIAGGITLGRLLEQSAIIKDLAARFPFADLDPTLGLFLLCLTCATLSAFMSNTATVVLLIPLASTLIPSPSTAVLVAISASFGVPFIISTPANAMAFGQGGVRFGDMFWPGIFLMIIGCAIVGLTGRQVMSFVGIP